MVTTIDRLRGELMRVLRTATGHDITIEEYADGDRYLVRAELPGIDPVRDASVSVYDGLLKIEVERVDWHQRDGSEFRYGAFSRTVDLPRRAAEETLSARYDRGVLEVSVEVCPAPPISRTVPIAGEEQNR